MRAAGFSRFRDADPGRLHFAAHSHHPWPDATEKAHAQYWADSARLADHKWDKVFGEVVPAAQGHVARLIGLPDPRQVAFAPNTHEFVSRIYSCFEGQGRIAVLATGAEFHSFRRQSRRLQEAGRIELVEVAPEPFDTFEERFIRTLRSRAWDMVWLSHVFFDSGYVVQDLAAIASAAPKDALVCIDGYHAFCALPVDISAIADRVFYLAGGYKYAMSGEGACWLAVPRGCELRPVDTGWYASFESLAAPPGGPVPYSGGGMRFWGATFDPSGLYRFNAAMDWLVSSALTIADVHRHAVALQKHFLDGLARAGLEAWRLVPPLGMPRGNFLAFDVDRAEEKHARITAEHVVIDRRDRRLRFGFGIYQDEHDVRLLLEALARALR